MHALKDVLLAGLCVGTVANWVVGTGCLWQRGEHGRFSNGEVFELFAKVNVCGGGKTICTFTQIDVIHVAFKNFIFGQVVFNFDRHHGLIGLTRQCAFIGQKEVFSQLLGDGGCTLGFTRMQDVIDHRAGKAVVVDPVMLIKACVFNR